MLSEDLKQEVIDNIDTYSLDDIEAKLSVLCVRNKVSFSKEGEGDSAGSTSFNMSGFDGNDDAIPAWIKAVLNTQKNMQ
jgi:hypothetical protein